MATTHRKIINLQVENVMRLKAVSIQPGGGVVVIGGANAQGKTSLLDSISMLVGGRKMCPKEPINKDHDWAKIEGLLGELALSREFWRDPNDPTQFTSELTVKDADGAKMRSPQAILDDLCGALMFDPLEFARMSKGDAASTLRELVGLDVEQLEEELSRVYSRRTEKGQEKRASQAVVDDMPWYGDIGERRSVVEIGSKMRAAGQQKANHTANLSYVDRCKRDVVDAQREFDRIRDEIARLNIEAQAAIQSKADAGAVLQEAESELVGYQAPDIEAIEAELSGVEKHNQQVDANERREDRANYAEMIAQEWKSLDQQHEQIATNIRKQTEAVEYPIEGLELRHGGVYFQDVPFEQGSRAERIKVSLAMGMAMNEGMAILLIRDGSVLDKESMTVLEELAHERDFQIFVEMARGYSDQPGAIIISDGEVVE